MKKAPNLFKNSLQTIVLQIIFNWHFFSLFWNKFMCTRQISFMISFIILSPSYHALHYSKKEYFSSLGSLVPIHTTKVTKNPKDTINLLLCGFHQTTTNHLQTSNETQGPSFPARRVDHSPSDTTCEIIWESLSIHKTKN